ncbi:hypothetical protein AQ905_30060 [Burkholderia pseudomallei]|nr:hypothetical protein AQ905_30060 [Burkholderia pseudomallei]
MVCNNRVGRAGHATRTKQRRLPRGFPFRAVRSRRSSPSRANRACESGMQSGAWIEHSRIGHADKRGNEARGSAAHFAPPRPVSHR